ncbi:MAG: helix-turn-helix domain-containing protein [Brevundimonas sp.]
MTPAELDIIVRVAGATLLLTAAAVLSRGRGRVFFLPLAVCLCGFLAGNTPDPALRLSDSAGQVAVFLSGFAAVFLWWFCLSVFDSRFRPRGLVLATGVVWMVIAAVDRGLLGEALAGVGLSWLLIVLGFGMVGHLAWRLIADRPGDLIDSRRQARVVVVVLMAGQLFADLVVDVVMGLDWQPRAFSILQNAVLLAFTGLLLRLHPRLRPAVAASQPRAAPPTAARVGQGWPTPMDASPETRMLSERLGTLVEVDRVHLDPDLTFGRFVTLMGASDRTVRRLINQQLGHDHFRTFLNSHRMVEARRRLADPAHRHDKLITIALDSGFSSLASFNRVFQDFEGCPPSVFRKAALDLAATSKTANAAPALSFEERSAGF